MEGPRIQIDRSVHTQSTLDEELKLQEPPSLTAGQRIKRALKGSCQCSRKICLHRLLGFFPFVKHVKTYRENLKENLLGDLTAGLTVGITHIPMGFSFALIANVPVVYGLYGSFWPVLIYFFFGQSPHCSFGTMAIMSIMLSEATYKPPVVINSDTDIAAPGNETLIQYVTGLNDSQLDGAEAAAISPPSVVEATMLVTMLSGIILILMSVLRLSKVVVFIPVSCIGGFTTAAAFHIATSQVKFVLGISIPRHVGLFKFVKIWKEIFLEMPNTNICDLVIFILCFIFLVIIKEILNPRLRKKMPVPIPGEIITVIIVCLVSYFAKLSDKYGIRIVREVPVGFSPPSIPSFNGFSGYLVDAFLIAVICFAVSYAMASTFGIKHQYEVDPAQEMLTYGICHLIGSWFGSFAGAAAPPRCTILDTTGAKTQAVHLFTAVVLLLVILLAGPVFEPLTNSCLSTIVIVALFPLFKQFLQLGRYWKVNKYDFAIWLVTWACVVFLDIGIGLAIGVIFSIATLAVQACYSDGNLLAQAGHADIHQTSTRQETPQGLPGIKVFRFESSLHFTSYGRFKEQLFALTVDPQKLATIKAKQNKDPKKSKKSGKQINGSRLSDNSDVYIAKDNDPDHSSNRLLSDIFAIVIDCSSIGYIDAMGMNLLIQLKVAYGHVGINLVLAGCSDALLRKLHAAGISQFDEGGTFPTIHDAVAYLSHGSS